MPWFSTVNRGVSQLHNPRKGEQQQDSGTHGQTEPKRTRTGLLRYWKFSSQDADKYDVIDPENNLERGQSDQGKRSFGCQQLTHSLHEMLAQAALIQESDGWRDSVAIPSSRLGLLPLLVQ